MSMPNAASSGCRTLMSFERMASDPVAGFNQRTTRVTGRPVVTFSQSTRLDNADIINTGLTYAYAPI